MSNKGEIKKKQSEAIQGIGNWTLHNNTHDDKVWRKLERCPIVWQERVT